MTRATDGFIQPMLATLVDQPFNDTNWIFEIKWDGYRAIAVVADHACTLFSRNHQDLTHTFAPIADELATLKHQAVFDGEVVVLDEKGRSSFQALQDFRRDGKGDLLYYVFDLLRLDGRDLTDLPLLERKTLLKKVLDDAGFTRIRFSDHVAAHGKAFFAKARGLGAEGMVAKESASTYQSGVRSTSWLKIKTHLRQEAVICGFTAPGGQRTFFGALILGVYQNDTLTYIGHTGTGFDEPTRKEIHAKLAPLIRKTSPFGEIPKTNAPATWVRPAFVCEVSFQEWTADGSLRQPVFLGLRDDKDPRDIHRERPRRT